MSMTHNYYQTQKTSIALAVLQTCGTRKLGRVGIIIVAAESKRFFGEGTGFKS